jgi:hypothetical protein
MWIEDLEDRHDSSPFMLLVHGSFHVSPRYVYVDGQVPG